MAARPPDLLLVKLGGSLITDKAREGSARAETIARLARELVEGMIAPGAQVILGHGSGSFGHRAALEGRVQERLSGPQSLAGASRTQHAARELHQIVLRALLDAGACPFSLAPSAWMIARAGRPSACTPGPLIEALDRGFLPVVFGDVFLDRDRGACIGSTEQVLSAVARTLRRRGRKVTRALWLGDTDGVYDAAGRTVDRLPPTSLALHRPDLKGSAAPDVTGGMLHRVETCVRLSRIGIESWILDGGAPGRLRKALRGERVGGTCVPAARAIRSKHGR